jgi:hypothetical protein
VNRIGIAAAFVLALVACQRTAEPEVKSDEPVRGETGKLENDNLLNLVFGAAVVDRDNELSLESSAAHAIDGSDFTAWSAAPGGRLTGVVSLPTATRLQKLGVAMPTSQATGNMLRIDTSMDGRTWSKGIEANVKTASPEPQLFDLQPVVARYLRVGLESTDPNKAVLSLHATGTEVEPYAQRPIEGCWEINGQPARFARTGAHVTGTIGPMTIDGGTDGRVYRLTWLEGPMWGYAAVSTSVDGQHLTGVRWHEEVNPKHNGDGWFGKRVPCVEAVAMDGAGVADAVIARSSNWRLYGVRFDRQDRVLPAESTQVLDLAARFIAAHPDRHFRVVAREFRSPSPASNRSRCDARLAAMREVLKARGADLSRIEFVNAGTERHPLAVDFTSQRVMDSGVDLQVVPR